MEFSSCYLSINDRTPTKKDFEKIEQNFAKKIGKNYFLVSTELTKDFFWLSARYDSKIPRSDIVVNVRDFSLEDNPRKEDQVEPRKQFFSLYDFNRDVLYVSSLKNKNIFEEIINLYTVDVISIKNIIKDIDEFYAQISSIQKICFSSVKRDLFSSHGLLQQSLCDNYAMEEPEYFSIEAIYKKSLDSKIKNVISCLRQQKSQGKLKKIIIQGKDDQGFEKIFNEGTFVNKINVDYSSDEDNTGMIDEELIKNSLLRKLEINV